MYRALLRLKRFFKRILKVKAETRQTLISGVRSKIFKITILILATTLVAFLYPGENLFFPLDFPRKGEIAFEDIIAPFQVTVAKTPGEIKEEKDAAAGAIPVILEYDSQKVDSILARFTQFMASVDSSARFLKQRQKNAGRTPAALDNVADSLRNALVLRFPFIDGNTIGRLLKIGNNQQIADVIFDILKNDIYFTGVIADATTLPDLKSRSIIVRIDKREIFLVRDKLLDLPRAYVSFLADLNNRTITDSFDVDLYYDLGRHFIIPNLTLNAMEMESRRQAAIAEISPVAEVVPAGEVIARSGSRINDRQEKILEAMYKQKESLVKSQGWYLPLAPVMARWLLILTAFLMLYLYLYYFHGQLFLSNPKVFSLFLIYGLELVLIYFIGTRLNLSVYLYPVAIFAALVTILFDAEVGIFNVFILALLLGVLHRFNFTIVLVTIVVGTVTCYSTQQVRHRSEFFRTIVYLSLTYVVLILLIESFKVSPPDEIINLAGLGLVNGIVSPILTIGLLPIFESLFGFTTDITLLELSDLNHPLLKRLSLEAPGTYHHSIIVGNLAEAAAKSIGANSLLARVGAYYHDIGKMEIPEYFVENQLGIKSKHDALTPTMSAIILSSHVKKGRLLGEEADLPDEVLNFIEEHHGTMTMNYFLNKAKELGIENPPIDDFRYPGPKPRTRETAIVMLADTTEAASRTLANPKPARISTLVQNIINDRFQSGELEDCPLTLKDLADIRESFTQILIGVFHYRIEYPKREETQA
ncbi:putative 7TM receptor with intracellular metal dependent phosphohydrolase [Candidatus Zixiibacteriota bacterium]|nr:putative 7TM receptor with intracellular metal dependent phosphohydrolase [candidate division Zixibacteria bacterium]